MFFLFRAKEGDGVTSNNILFMTEGNESLKIRNFNNATVRQRPLIVSTVASFVFSKGITVNYTKIW